MTTRRNRKGEYSENVCAIDNNRYTPFSNYSLQEQIKNYKRE